MQPQTCNIGCAELVLPFWAECRQPFTQLVDAHTLDTFKQVVLKCQHAQSTDTDEKWPFAREFSLACDAHDVVNCIPKCNETLHGHILLATVSGDDSSYTCEFHHGLYSWVGKAGAGGFMGSDVSSFVASVLSGAGGFYVLLLVENSAGVGVTLTIRPQQTVSIHGDPAVRADGGGSRPIWGGGGFTVQQHGVLSLANLVVAGPLSVTTGGKLTISSAALTATIMNNFLPGGEGLQGAGSEVAFDHVTVPQSGYPTLTGTITVSTINLADREFQPPDLIGDSIRVFNVVSGPCTTRNNSKCVGRPNGYTQNEQCVIKVLSGGKLAPCSVWQVRLPASLSPLAHTWTDLRVPLSPFPHTLVASRGAYAWGGGAHPATRHRAPHTRRPSTTRLTATSPTAPASTWAATAGPRGATP
jgi:hypothetical protein